MKQLPGGLNFKEIKLTERAMVLLVLVIGRNWDTGRNTGVYELDHDVWAIETYREIIRELNPDKWKGYFIRNVPPKIQNILARVINHFSYGGMEWQGNSLYFYFEH